MWYAQKNYSGKMGFVESAQGQVAAPGPYTIAQIGCFLTAFSNLTVLIGENVDPNVLNIYFTEHKVYMADPSDGKGVHDDLAWSSISAYDSHISIAATGMSSWPNSDKAIVKFEFEKDGQHMIHFCLVDSVANRTIVDSYDGVVKQPGPYGAPVAWATYTKNIPLPVPTPMPSSPSIPTAKKTYSVLRDISGFRTADNALNHKDPVNTIVPKIYYVFNESDGMINVTSIDSVPGSWINPNDNTAVATTPIGNKDVVVQAGWGLQRIAQAAGRSDSGTSTCWAQISAANGSNNWQAFNASLKPGQHVIVPPEGSHGEDEPQYFTVDPSGAGLYEAIDNAIITDLKNPASKGYPLDKGTKVGIVGTFMVPDNTQVYGMPKFSHNGKMYYGVPMNILNFSKSLSSTGSSGTHKSFFDRTVIAAGTIVGVLEKQKAKKALKKG